MSRLSTQSASVQAIASAKNLKITPHTYPSGIALTLPIAMLPGSKSETMRAVLLSAFAAGNSPLEGALDCEDVRAARDCVKVIHHAWSSAVPSSAPPRLFLHDSGILLRFLPAMLATRAGRWFFDGSTQLRERPSAPLHESLKALGAKFTYLGKAGCLPFIMTCIPNTKIQTLTLSGKQSSQYISAMMCAMPLLLQPLRLEVRDISPTHPYLQMTRAMVKRFGGVLHQTSKGFNSQPGGYWGTSVALERDWNLANTLFAFAMLLRVPLTLPGLDEQSLQSGRDFLSVLERLGASFKRTGDSLTLHPPMQIRGGFEIDLFACAEMMPVLCALSACADAPVTIANVAHLAYHESNRIESMYQALTALGVGVKRGLAGLCIEPCPVFTPGRRLSCFDDHRIAMSLSLLGATRVPMTLEGVRCVRKSAPNFFNLLKQLGTDLHSV